MSPTERPSGLEDGQTSCNGKREHVVRSGRHELAARVGAATEHRVFRRTDGDTADQQHRDDERECRDELTCPP